MTKLFNKTIGGIYYEVYFNEKSYSVFNQLIIFEGWKSSEMTLHLIIQVVEHNKRDIEYFNILYCNNCIKPYILDEINDTITKINDNEEIKTKVLKTLK